MNRIALLFRQTIGIVIISILTYIPVFFWFISTPVVYRFTSRGLTLTSIGQITGLMGIMLFSLAMIMSVRLRWFDFGYYNKQPYYNLN